MHVYPITRRELLQSAACGFGALAARSLAAATAGPIEQPPMFAPRAKRVIFLFMGGGPSQVDTFDYKPELVRRDGSQIDFVGVRFGTFGQRTQRQLMRPLWPFQQHGESGAWVSSLFPYIAQHVDKICFLKDVAARWSQ